jgi:tetraacyldisaccharide 4'-kinase
MSRTQKYLDLISGRNRSPLAYFARAGLAVASGGYCLAVSVRNKLFDFGIKSSVTVSVPVVSIGNITTGGTGKTPMVEYVCRFFREKGLRVAILSRGYGSDKSGGMNDEGLLLYQNLPDVPHLQGPERAELAHIAVEELESQLLVLDDGLQHRRLARNLDIVLIDATNPFGYGWLLPRGLLREPARAAIRRAGAVILTRCDLISAEALAAIENQLWRMVRPGTPVARSVHRPTEVLMASGEVLSLDRVKGKKAVIFCGLGNPAAFRATVESLGVQVVDEKHFTDHHRYTEADIAALSGWVAASMADLVLTSQKDLVKLVAEHLGGRPLGAIRIGLEITQGLAEINHLLDQLAAECNQASPWQEPSAE